MRQRAFAWTCVLIIGAIVAHSISRRAAAQERDRDTDSDGLSDYREVHKYCTDPGKKDTAGTGTPGR